MTVIRRHRWLQALLLFGPAAIWAAAFIVFPMVEAVKMSLSQVEYYHLVHDWTTKNFQLFFSNPLYTEALVRSAVRAAIVAALAVGISLPLAHFISFRVKRHQFLWFAGVVVALWLGYLLRIVGWRILLGREGVLNGLLTSAGILEHPTKVLVFNPFAVILVQTHLAMSFAFIPIFVVMQRVPHRLMQAASDLGAPRWRQILEVEAPLIAPGVAVGATFAFVLSFGDYFAPQLVGDPGSIGIANLASSQFEHGLAWPLGAAIGVVMIVSIFAVLALPGILLAIYRRVAGLRARRGPEPSRVSSGALEGVPGA
ncbi:MAG: ABC transporter permease [Actinobacteria bacterium]|nr:ABC transporter permease [Actinomycetota bacterium]